MSAGDRVIPPVLETERAILRPWTLDDAPWYFDILGRREVTEWLGEPEPLADIDAARSRIEHIEWDVTELVPGARAIVPHDLGFPVGAAMLWPLPGDDEVEIGWNLHPDHNGQGWATEGARAVLDEALANGHPRIWAGMWPHNHRSAGVCVRLGMPDLGEVDDPWYGTIEYRTSRMFCVENPAAADGRSPADILADRMSRATFEHATDHPPA